MRISIAVAALLATTTACADFDTRPLTGLEAVEATQRAGAAIAVLDSCPAAQDEEVAELAALPALIGSVVPLAASFGISSIRNAIEDRKDGRSGQFVAAGVSKDVRTDLNSGKCLVIYRGLFGAPEPTASDVRLSASDLKTLGLVDMPAFYMEARADLDDDVLRLEPQYVRYGQSSARIAGSGMKHVGIVLAMTERRLSAEEDAPVDNEAIALFRFDLGRLEIGRSYLQAPGAPVLTGTGAIQTLPAGANGTPANLFAYVVESEQPGPVLTAFAEAFASQEDALTTALSGFLTGLLPEQE